MLWLLFLITPAALGQEWGARVPGKLANGASGSIFIANPKAIQIPDFFLRDVGMDWISMMRIVGEVESEQRV